MSEVGEMLRLARQRMGVTQKAASARLGVPQPVLSRYENGVSEPDRAFLMKAASFYKVPQSFFELKDPVFGPPVSVHPMLRGKADVSARDLDMITAELNIRLIHIRRLLDGVDISARSDIPRLDVEEIGNVEEIAALVRAHWGVPAGPIKNLVRLVERAGVLVGWSNFGGASVSGVTFRAPGAPPLILLNATHPADRLRFTLAHELGHMVMHRFPTADMESEATEFASAFLMPAKDILPAFKGRKITLELLAALKKEWRVAMQALLMRASKLGLLTPNQSRYLWQRISARGWRTTEPPELNFPAEQPQAITKIIQAHIRDLGYSKEELAKMLRIWESEFEMMYGPIDGPEGGGPRLRVVI